MAGAWMLAGCGGGGGGGGGGNAAPTANAGADQTVDEQTAVTLSGSGNDSDGAVTSYAWTQTGGPSVTLTGADTATASFDSPVVLGQPAGPGRETLTFRLTVTDDAGATGTDTVAVAVDAVNLPPTVAVSGPDAADERAGVGFDAVASDADGSIASYAWTQVGGPDVTLTGADSDAVSFTTPSVSTQTTVALEVLVTDNEGAAEALRFTLLVEPVAGLNDPPLADAGDDRLVGESSSVTLSGLGSADPDGSIAAYAWTQVGGLAVTLDDPTAVEPGFTTPDVVGPTELTFELVVTDNEGLASAPDQVVITVDQIALVSGRITFDFVPYPSASSGLDYGGIEQRAARGVVVQALDGSDAVLAETTTDANGDYALEVPPGGEIRLRVRAQMLRTGTPGWNFTVVDNTSSNALYVLDGSPVAVGGGLSGLDLNAPSGWDGSAYSGVRAAAPFSVLDAVWKAVQPVLDADPDVVFPPLKLHWSPNNRPSGGFSLADLRSGEIGTSFFIGPGALAGTEFADGGIFLLGAADADTEEYDQHVITHEWGHYFEEFFSRADSIGGRHRVNEELDMRLAFGEGWGNAFAGIAMDDPVYRDSSGSGQGSGFGIDVDRNAWTVEGWYAENSVQAILYDLYDGGIELGTADDIALGFGPLYEVLTTTQRTGVPLTSVFPFIAALKAANPAQASAIDQLVADQAIVAAGIDEWGSTETNDAGNPDVLPVYHELTVDGPPVTVCSIDDFFPDVDVGEARNNKLGSRQFLRFTVAVSDTYRFRAETSSAPAGAATTDPDIILHRAGIIGVWESSADGVEDSSSTANPPSPSLVPGEYVLEVYEWQNTQETPIGRTCIDVSVSTL